VTCAGQASISRSRGRSPALRAEARSRSRRETDTHRERERERERDRERERGGRRGGEGGRGSRTVVVIGGGFQLLEQIFRPLDHRLHLAEERRRVRKSPGDRVPDHLDVLDPV